MKSNKITPLKKDKFDGITIDAEQYTTPETVEPLCPHCSKVLTRLLDHSQQNPSWYCNHCSVTYDDLDIDNVRHKQRLSVPQTTEPSITSVGNVPDVSIRHTPPIRGGLAELQKKGIKITSYKTTEKE